MQKNKLGVLVSFALLAVPAVSLASDLACVNPQTLATTGNTVVGTGNGCTAVNNNFQNFNVTDSGTTTDFPAPSGGGTANIEFSSNGTSSPLATLDFTTTTLSANSAACSTDSFCVDEGSHTGTENISYFVQPSSGSIYDLGLTLGTLTTPADIDDGSTILVQEQFCLGAASVSGCGTSDLGYLQMSESNATGAWVDTITVCTPGASGCTQTHPGSAAISLATPQTEIAIEDTITITTTTGSRGVFIDSFDNTLDQQAPEPSTFVLLGSALGGLGLLRAARRRKA